MLEQNTNKNLLLDIFKEFYDNFTGNNNDKDLIQALTEYQNFVDNKVWFRFFNGDTLVHTVSGIKADLQNNNREYIIECIEIAINNRDGFIVNYD